MSKPGTPSSRRKIKPVEVHSTALPGVPPISDGFPGYAAALKYLNERVNFERVRKIDRSELKLERMHALMRALGDPHRAVKFVHVTGS